jgi:hypothetical protein
MNDPTNNVEQGEPDQQGNASCEQPVEPNKPTVDELAYGSYLMVYDLYAFMQQTRQQLVMVSAHITDVENRMAGMNGKMRQAEQQVGQKEEPKGEKDAGKTAEQST